MTIRFDDDLAHGAAAAKRPLSARWAGLAMAAMLLAGCAGVSLSGNPASPAVNGGPAVQAVAQDPVAAFAATATPGAEGQVVLADSGRAARVRLLRSYFAGSGRECREVLIGSGLEERSALACRDGETWVATRPLLRGQGSGLR